MSDEYVEVSGVYQHHTVAAVLVEVSTDDKRWIPISQLDPDETEPDEWEEDKLLTLHVKEWWAKREGLI